MSSEKSLIAEIMSTSISPSHTRGRAWYQYLAQLRSLSVFLDDVSTQNLSSQALIEHEWLTRKTHAFITSIPLDNDSVKNWQLQAGRFLRGVGSQKALRERFGILPSPADNESRIWYLEALARRRAAGIAQRVRALADLELVAAYNLKKPCVFSTLTVAPDSWSTVWRRGSSHFADWLRAMRKDWDMDGYLAVVERGSKTGALHYHVLSIHSPDVVGYWRDVNRQKGGENRQITSMHALWSFGYSQCIAVRQGPRDAYALAGWHWPLKGGQPIKTSVSGVAAYIAKYVAKQDYHTEEGRLKSTWRRRASKLFGIRQLMLLWKTEPVSHLLSVVADPTVGKVLNLPPSVVRDAATRLLLEKMEQSEVSALLRELPPGVTYIARMQSTIQAIRSPNWSNMLLQRMSAMRVTGGCDESKDGIPPTSDSTDRRISGSTGPVGEWV